MEAQMQQRRTMTATETTNVDLLVSLTRLETMVTGLVNAGQQADTHLAQEIARVETDAKARSEAARITLNEHAVMISSMRLAWAKAGGVAAVVSAVVSSVLAVAAARVLGG